MYDAQRTKNVWDQSQIDKVREQLKNQGKKEK